ncbi:hypothetical protein [Rhodohalobacter sp. 8-1]|uniref:hypothetical protein n=1 Tax=Rhodohalobacter sp. 8-1 TaxID=3131972 RepID=UPI0030EC961C
MLNNFVLPASVSSGHAVEGVQPLQGFAPYNQLTQLVPTFRLAEDGSKPEDEEKKNINVEAPDAETEDEGTFHELLKLSFNVSFKEMLDYFLVPDHDKIHVLQAKFRNEREVTDFTIFAPTGEIPAKFENFRDQLHEFQMQLFKTPKGLHCHIIA